MSSCPVLTTPWARSGKMPVVTTTQPAAEPAACPECHGTLTPEGQYVSWCRACEWNVDPGHTPSGERALARWRLRAERRLVTTLFEELRGREGARPGWDLARVAGYAIALGVHAVTLLVLIAGGWLLVTGWPNWVQVALAVLLLLVAVALRPRPGRLGPDEDPLTRAEAPALFELLDRVSISLSAPSVQLVVINGEYNAGFGTVGWRRRRVLWLGAPLWRVLDPQERVALLGHEIGHSVNGDARHGLVVGTALETLAEWYEFTRAHTTDYGYSDAAAGALTIVAEWIQQALLRLLGLPIAGVGVLLERLHLRSGQRAEYLADELAARAGSTAAVIRSQEKLVLAEGVHFALSAAARRGERSLGDAAVEYVATVPDHEWDRRLRLARRHEHRADVSHPPTALRVDLLRSRPMREAAVVLHAEAAAEIDRELTGPLSRAERNLRHELLAED